MRESTLRIILHCEISCYKSKFLGLCYCLVVTDRKVFKRRFCFELMGKERTFMKNFSNLRKLVEREGATPQQQALLEVAIGNRLVLSPGRNFDLDRYFAVAEISNPSRPRDGERTKAQLAYHGVTGRRKANLVFYQRGVDFMINSPVYASYVSK